MSVAIRFELVGYPCPCPGTPHEIEAVYLEPEATIPMGMAVRYRISNMTTRATELDAETQARGEIAPFLMQYGIRTWTFTDEKGGRVTVSPSTIAELLPFAGPGNPGFEVCDKCMTLYLEAVSRPLRERWNKLLNGGQTADSTSQTPQSTESPPTQPSPSLPENTDGQPSEDPAP